MKSRDIEWIFNLKNQIPKFLVKLKGKRRKGFYHYSLTGDYLGEYIKWGLGNAVFFLKIIYTLNLESNFQEEIHESIKFIESFQRKNGSFFDPLIWIITSHRRIRNAFFNFNLDNLLNQHVIRAETRQAFSALNLYNNKPKYNFMNLPKSKDDVVKFLSILNWNFPWGAGSHFSHLIFLLYNSSFPNRKLLIERGIEWVNTLQNEKDGFWYKGNPSVKEKINGAMKIITGLKVVNKVKFNFVKTMIDNVLMASCDAHACDNFNVSYVLKYCNEITKNKYRYDEIENFMYNRLNIYKNFYHPNKNGFSFLKNQAGRRYYGALITKGKNEPDIHGTLMFLWGISIIAQTLKINKELDFKEFIT